MSSSVNNLIGAINDATVQLNRYLPLLMYIFGIVGNLLNTAVLSRRTLCSNSCAVYFLASSIAGLIVIVSGLTTRLTAGWFVDLSETNEWLCKIRIFVLFTSRTILIWLFVCAAIDRWLLSNRNVHRRHLSSLKNAQRSIAAVICFSMLLNGPLLYCYSANLIGTPAQCYGFSVACRLYTDLAFTCGNIVIPCLLMMFFGLLTIHNIRQIQKRVNTRPTTVANIDSVHTFTNTDTQEQQQKKKLDRNLFRMLCVQILCIILCNAPYTIYRLYSTLTPAAASKSLLQNAIERLLFNLCTNFTYLAAAMPFYLYTLCGGRIFQSELLNIIKDTSRKCRCS